MTTPEALNAIADRVERDEPSDLLNWDIMDAVVPNHRRTQAILYTTSLKAAVTLVPEGDAWTVGQEPDGTPFARIWPHELVWASTPAAALTAAALRARAADMQARPSGSAPTDLLQFEGV